MFKMKLEELREKNIPASDDLVYTFNQRILEAMSSAKITYSIKGGPRKSKPWFDKDCYDMKKLAKESLKKYRKTNRLEDRECYASSRKKYLALLDLKRKGFDNEKQEVLRNAKDSKTFWKTIALYKSTSIIQGEIAIQYWLNFYRELMTTEKNLRICNLHNVISQNDPILDTEITNADIYKEIAGLKSNKACGPDGIPNEVLKILPDSYILLLKQLYNSVMTTGKYPAIWTNSTIHPIFKNGYKNSPSNYRDLIEIYNNSDLPSVNLPEFGDIHLLLYADDIAIIGESRMNLQKKIKILKEYLDENLMTLNESKSKIMVFRNGGEVASADEEAARKYPEKLAKIIKDGGYCAHQIFNADETGLFWKKMPTRTYIAKSEKNASGFKAAKDRVTLLLCSNASGDRMLKPLLVNRSLKPRALKGKDLNTLPVHWMANKKAWVTTAIFTEWFNKCFVPEVENYMKEMGLEFKILLILDNAPGHPNLEHPNIKVVFFPPNTTSLIQPLDQGIISTFKKYYVKFTFQFIFDKLESDTITVTEVWKQFNILNCVDHVALAIAEIKSQTLNACWKAAWPECVSKKNESNRTTIVTSDIISIAKEIGGEGFDDFGEHDIEELLVDEALNDDDILESMVDTTKDFETVDSELEDVTPLDEKLLREGLQLSGKLENFFIQNDNDVERALKFQRDLKFCMSGYRELYKELVKPSQRLITDYLVKEKKITEVPKEALPCRSDDVILSSSDESDLAPILKRVRTLSDSE
ncbi:hypothetical protein LAZ67_6001499 [Cordylochernes scorpioides]|uniref:DDE-1 domain-containing protein n=1 Tax=Cordylochernes scorpioides TaxID=51811 RepID=A0ABY6KJ95_9ARAC|nr:hypothetical protein LAZ67_6001499 [Cordylochernes scorpioides]